VRNGNTLQRAGLGTEFGSAAPPHHQNTSASLYKHVIHAEAGGEDDTPALRVCVAQCLLAAEVPEFCAHAPMKLTRFLSMLALPAMPAKSSITLNQVT